MLHYAEETENTETETTAGTNETEIAETENNSGTGETEDNSQAGSETENVQPVTSDEKAGEIPKPGGKKNKKPNRSR